MDFVMTVGSGKTSDQFANDTKIQAKHPHRKRLMMSGKHSVGQVAEGSVTHPTKGSVDDPAEFRRDRF
jgi:hypothetical protein